MENQDLPFDRLVRELRPERQLCHALLAQVFSPSRTSRRCRASSAPGSTCELQELGNGTAKVDLTIYLRQQEGTLVTVWEYASALFDAATIARWARHFQTLLAAAAADPQCRVADLPLLTAGGARAAPGRASTTPARRPGPRSACTSSSRRRRRGRPTGSR